MIQEVKGIGFMGRWYKAFALHLMPYALYLLFCAFNWEVIDKEVMAKKFDEMNKHFNALESYSLTVSHASFVDYASRVPHEKSIGYFKKEKNNYHSFLLGIHTIQNSNCKLVLDSAHQTVVIADPDHSFENSLTQADYSLLLSKSSSIKKTHAEKEAMYRLEFEKENPLSAYEFSLDQKEFVSKIILYYNRETKREDNTVTKPRMEITFSSWSPNIGYPHQEFDESKYVFKKDGQYFLQPSFAGKYQLLDQRMMTKDKN